MLRSSSSFCSQVVFLAQKDTAATNKSVKNQQELPFFSTRHHTFWFLPSVSSQYPSLTHSTGSKHWPGVTNKCRWDVVVERKFQVSRNVDFGIFFKPSLLSLHYYCVGCLSARPLSFPIILEYIRCLLYTSPSPRD